MTRPRQRRRRRRFRVFAAALVVLGGLGAYAALPPDCATPCDLAEGVDLTVDRTAELGRVWTLRIDYAESGLRVGVRPFVRQDDGTHSYTLIPLDLGAALADAVVAVNLTLYEPGDWMRSYPGATARSLETVVVDGETSHIHAHSYLWYWDSENRLHVSLTKPPSPEALEAAVTGFSVQGNLLRNGELSRFAGTTEPGRITVVGGDPAGGTLWLAVASRARPADLARHLQREGATYAAQLDSSSASSMVLGPAAPLGLAFKGTRGWRPLASFLYVTR